MIKIIRSFRMARLLRKFAGVGTIVKSVMSSLPSVNNIAVLLILCFYIFALAGMSLFGRIPDGGTLGIYMNFRSFPRAMLTLYYLATGEYWNAMMHDVLAPPACFPTEQNDFQRRICEDPLNLDGSCCPEAG